ncbi:MAG: hypothetical protein ACXWCG_11725, partial [Flavitalea sp.]
EILKLNAQLRSMHKILVFALLLGFLSGCSGKKEKKEPVTTPTETSTVDKAMKEWLQGKEWKAENNGAPMSFLKIYRDGHCEYGTSSDGWSFENDAFGIHMGDSKNPIVTWPVKKIDEQSFSLYVAPTQSTYIYRFVANL